jgi:hypothetical protein
VCDAIAGNIDFLPTFVKLAGGTVPADRKIDGKDISPLLFGETKESPHAARYYYSGYKLQAVRVGPWKLAIAPQAEGMGLGGPGEPASLEKPRLYNLDVEIGERTDVADQHPEIVARLKQLAVKMAAELGDGKPGPEVRPAGVVQNPVTLYPTEESAPKAGATEKQATAQVMTLDSVKVGATLSGAAAPQVAGLPITITCDLDTTATSGVIVAHGGARVGYALYLKDSHAVFAVRHSGANVARITSKETLSGKTALIARLATDGTMTLSANNQVVASGKTTGPLKSQPKEDFCVGWDSDQALDDYDGAALFQGKIFNLKVSTIATESKP